MKRNYVIIGLLFFWLAMACTEDKGNYDYTPLNDLSISGIEAEYLIERDSQLIIPVTITANEDFQEGRYDYLWYAWRINNAADPDTLSLEKDLDVAISIVPGEYDLRYIVTDKETKIIYTYRTDLTVIDSYSKGIMALSNAGGEADVTFINAVNTITPHVYLEANGETAGTNPSGIFYIGGGEFVNPLVVIATEEGTKVANPADFSEFMDFSELFYFAPEPGIMQCLCKSNWGYDEYVIVDGKVYNRYLSFVENLYQPYDPQAKGDYYAAPFSMYEASDAFFYDKKGQRFIYNNYGVMIPVEASSGAFNAADMQMDMVYGFALDENLRAVMEDEAGQRYMISATKAVTYSDDYSETYIRVTPISMLPMDKEGCAEASTFAMSTRDMGFLYYAYGNKIACISTVTGNILAVYDGFGAGKQVDYIEFDRTENTDRLWVGVSDGSGTAESGSIYFLKMASDGSLTEETHFENVCGKVVDFEYKP